MENSDQLGILKQLERGEISASEADARLNEPPLVEQIESPPFDRAQLPAWVGQIGFWAILIGVLVVILGTWIIAVTARANILWFLLGLPIVLLGALIISIGASAFSGHWLYVNVENSRRKNKSVRFGIPFPIGLLRLAMWFIQFAPVKRAGRVNLRNGARNFNAFLENPQEFVDAVERELRAGRGITIDVDDKGERVQVYIV